MPDLDPERIEAYGLRPLSAEEQHIFRGLDLALDVFKGRLPATITIGMGTRRSTGLMGEKNHGRTRPLLARAISLTTSGVTWSRQCGNLRGRLVMILRLISVACWHQLGIYWTGRSRRLM
jgi:hypothetical protein